MNKTILTPLHKKFLKALFTSYLGQKFFLTGGTALAEFYLKHRLSEDLDLFTVDQTLLFDVVNSEILKLANGLALIIDKQIASPTFNQYIFSHKGETLKVDIVKDVPIRFGKTKLINGIVVDSLENIAVGKLLAMFGRANAKDFIDLYFLLKKKKISFQEIFTMAKKKDLGLSEFYLAHMILQIQRIETFPKTLEPFDQKELVRFFLNLANKLFKKIKPEM